LCLNTELNLWNLQEVNVLGLLEAFLVPSLTLASAICHLKVRPIITRPHASHIDTGAETVVNQYEHVSETFRQDIADLDEMATCHQSAKQALDIIE
jgi:hypothetical protein